MERARKKVLNSVEAVHALQESVSKHYAQCNHAMLAMYSSIIDAIVVDPSLMLVPLNDHMVHRGHAVFDTCNVHGGRLYGIDFHLDRLLTSAKKAKIDLGNKFTKAMLKDIILQTVAATSRTDNIYVRYWLSAGWGDFQVHPNSCVGGANFYVVVHESGKNHGEGETRTVEEVTVSVPMKSPFLATMKSNNYLINALCAMEAKSRGGDQGLQLDSRGFIAEFAVASAIVIGPDRVLRTPKTQNILTSTTVMRVVQITREQMMPRGILSGVEFADITENDVYESLEFLQAGGGDVKAVTKFNGRPINGGKPGPIYKKLHELLVKDMTQSPFVDNIPYNNSKL